MTHEKSIERQNGKKVKLKVSFSVSHIGEDVQWNIATSVCQPGEKEFKAADFFVSVTDEEIFNAKMELWEKLKPLS